MDNTSLEFPPKSHWGIDPIYWSFCRLWITQIIHMVPQKTEFAESTVSVENNIKGVFLDKPQELADNGSHFLCNSLRPVSRVEICGIVVMVQTYNSCMRYTIDDGTAVIACVKWNPFDSSSRPLTVEDFQINEQSFKLGDLVCIQGKIDVFRGYRQIKIVSSALLSNPDSEALHWSHVMRLNDSTYSRPYSLNV